MGGCSIIPEVDVKILYFLGYPVIERVWWFGSPAVVYREFFMWLGVVNVVCGVLGFLVSWSVVRRFHLKDSNR